jgi:hypothetical protein
VRCHRRNERVKREEGAAERRRNRTISFLFIELPGSKRVRTSKGESTHVSYGVGDVSVFNTPDEEVGANVAVIGKGETKLFDFVGNDLRDERRRDDRYENCDEAD